MITLRALTGRAKRAISGAIAGLAVLAMSNGLASQASEPKLASPWVTDHATRVRLIAGSIAQSGQAPKLFVGIEIHLDDAWKTYWRNPGSSGVPPRLEWTGSENLADATIYFPAPERFPDRDGDTIGYKKVVVFPVEIRPADPKQPVKLKLSLEYGVCKDVCIPVQPVLELMLPADHAKAPSMPILVAALDRVPRAPGNRTSDPSVRNVRFDTQSAKPTIVIEATFPGQGKGADAFLEAPDGIWIPLAKPAAPLIGPNRTFLVDLTDGADIAELKGRVIRLTLVSEGGATDTSFKFE